ncbi:MAG: TIGR03364 family FAD-dependent oxidoreductase [Alphaproteobacteria bacterium]|nr:TIGR03364 family FAD-dependent oxidoreductase [Alphaproteobacteria bacterium]
MTGSNAFDIAIVGGGIVGLAHGLAAVRAGRRVVVVERDPAPVGASIRNFGFVTVTGQAYPRVWTLAARARDIWAEIAPRAGIDVLHRGLMLAAHRPETVAVLESFLAGPMAKGCALLGAREAQERFPMLRPERLAAVLTSPHELRIEPRTAIPRLSAFLETELGVTFLRGTAALGVEPGRIDTTAGPVLAQGIIVCPGPDLHTLFPAEISARAVTLCKLHMLRLAPQSFRLPSAVMMDLSLVRYHGYSGLPPVPALRERLEREAGESLSAGIHLIVVQSADGSLVVGDSHHYGDPPSPFADEKVDRLILAHAEETLRLSSSEVTERWLGVYPSADEPFLVSRPMKGVHLVMVTSGTGMSTSFALAEEVIGEIADA